MRDVNRPLKILRLEILMACACPYALLVTGAARAQSYSSQAPPKTAPQVLAEYRKPLSGTEVKHRRTNVEWRQGNLTVEADCALLSEVLQQVSVQTGVEFLNLDNLLHKRISVHFLNVSLPVGLQILLTDMDYASMGELRDPSTMRVVILERTAGKSATDSPAPEPPAQAEISQAETVQSSTIEPETPQSEGSESVVGGNPSPQIQAADLDPTTNLSVLGRALGDKRTDVQEAAIRALAERGGLASLDLLQKAFRESDSEAKMALIENIGSTVEVLPLLQEASQDSDKAIRDAALAVIFDSNLR